MSFLIRFFYQKSHNVIDMLRDKKNSGAAGVRNEIKNLGYVIQIVKPESTIEEESSFYSQ